MRRICLILPLLLLVGLSLAGCSSSDPDSGAVVVPHPGVEGLPAIPGQGSSGFRPVGYFSYQLPIIPITFTISADGSFSIDFSGEFATSLGDIRFGGGVAKSVATGAVVPTQSVGVTRLVICETGTNRQVCRGYAIHTGRKVQIALNGQFQETIENSLVTIVATPGSTVTVSDNGQAVNPGFRAAAHIDVEDFAFTAMGPYTQVNLEQSQGGTENDLAYDHVTGALQPVNGAEVANIRHYRAAKGWFRKTALPALNLPDEEDCAKTPSNTWRTSFTSADLKADITVACIFSVEKDFGYVVIGHNSTERPTSYYVYSYIWVR